MRSVKRCIRSNTHLVFRAIIAFNRDFASIAVRGRTSSNSKLGFLTKGAVSFIGGGTFRNAILTRASNNMPGLRVGMRGPSTRGLNRLVCFFRGTYTVSNCVLNMGPFSRPNIRDCGGGVFTLLNGPNCRTRGTRLRGELSGWLGGLLLFTILWGEDYCG